MAGTKISPLSKPKEKLTVKIVRQSCSVKLSDKVVRQNCPTKLFGKIGNIVRQNYSKNRFLTMGSLLSFNFQFFATQNIVGAKELVVLL